MATERTLLVVEDDTGLARQYRWSFPQLRVVTARNRNEAIDSARRNQPQVAIVDLGLPPDPDGISEGLATVVGLSEAAPGIKAIVATGHGGRESAMLAVTRGAHDFFEKPIDIDVLRVIVERAFRLHAIEEENRQLQQTTGAGALRRVVTNAESMLQVCRDIERLAATDVPLLLLGESGTGKDVLARSLHEVSPRSGGPFVAINCGAIPENLLESELFGHERGAFTGAVKQSIGRIETAQGGTLFLDEIGDLPMPLQVKLLRFLQDHVIERIGGRRSIPVDARIVSATNRNLDELIESGQFRLDLFYRLNIMSLTVPPLRERPGDPILLAQFFLRRFANDEGLVRPGLSESAIAALSAHSWPGNVRELENRVRRAVIMARGAAITAHDLGLDEAPAPVPDLRLARQTAEREAVQRALALADGSMSEAARILGVRRPTLYSLMETLGIDATPVKATASKSGTEESSRRENAE